MRGLIEDIARALVDQPDQVRGDEGDRGGGSTLELKVAEGDLGKVIGREGRTAKAMRTLLSVVSSHQGKRYVLKILE
ncbi:MAG TPA: KH domain-containing protein [Nitrospinota bacterium]|nr:KH domain-containing protein [Nitrospinota bacterium]